MPDQNNDQLKSTAGTVSAIFATGKLPEPETKSFAAIEKKQSENTGTISNTPPLTFGEKAVGLSFNPGGSTQVYQIKRFAADYIDLLNILRGETDNPEVKRQLSIAITEAQTSQMWAVKAITWQY